MKKTIEGKPLIVSASIGEQYAKSIKAVIKAMHKEALIGIKECYVVYAQDSDLPKNGNLLSQIRILFNRLLKKYNPIFSLLAKKVTERMVDRVLKNSSSTLKLSLKDMGDNLAIKTDLMSDKVKDITQASILESVGLIKTIPTYYLQDVQTAVANSITSGKGFSDLKQYLEKYYQGNERKAELVALDQTRKVYRKIQAQRLQELGVKKFIWIHSGGGNEPRQLHVHLNGKVCSFDDPPFIGVMYGERIYGLPGELPNCFTGSTNFFLSNGCKKLFRRWFDGELTKLITESGKVLMVTPNHPILTNNGWCAADKINVGDYVFKAVNQIFDGAETNIANVGVSASDLFNSIRKLLGGCSSTASCTAFEFHGDISDSEVDVIDIDSFLPDEFNANLCKELLEFLFTWSDKVRDEINLFEFSSEYEFISRAFFSSDCLVSRFNSLLALFSAHSSVHKDVRFRLISDINVVLSENSADHRTANIEFDRKRKLALSLFIQVDNFTAGHLLACVARAFDFWDSEAYASQLSREVVGVTAEFNGYFFETDSIRKQTDRIVQKISGINFSHYVYNLETSKNWYLAENIISHNCRCTMKPVIEFGDEKNDEAK